MEKSTSIKNIAQALITFHVKVEKIPKDASNPFFKSKYASLSNILETINDALNESGLSFVQFPTGENGLCTILMHAGSGEYFQAEYIMKPTKNDPQGIGSCITYQRRYALAAILGLNLDDDDDGNKASEPVKKEAKVNGTTELPWLNKNSLQYKAVVKRLKEQTATIEEVAKHYKLSQTIRAELEAIHLEPAPF